MKLEEENSASIFVEFIPVNYGLHLETLYFLCNNNSMEKMEIIGDGIIFEKTFVKVQVILMNNFVFDNNKATFGIGSCRDEYR